MLEKDSLKSEGVSGLELKSVKMFHVKHLETIKCYIEHFFIKKMQKKII